MRRTALPLLLLAASCASGWTLVGTAGNPALREGEILATFERGRGDDRERRVDVRSGGDDVHVATVDDVMDHVRPLDTPDAAIAYADLVRELGVLGSGAVGLAVRPDPSLAGPGGSGRYSRADALGWGIEFLPTARPNAGGIEVSHVVLLPPIQHPVLPHAASPWRLVLLKEVVFADGTIRGVDERTLTNGQDAARFAGR